ncbi:hypothetical protein DFH28DRAFT_1048360 [Melampsora americana]|nr:hypothetical protein DFH28DRAFT_1048360 [Melampsora americana]
MTNQIMSNNRVEMCDACLLNATGSLKLDQKNLDNENSSNSSDSTSIGCNTPPSSRTSNSSHSPAVVAIWENDELIEFEFLQSYSERSFSTTKTKEKDQEEIDTLEGEHLPYFFSLTREERKMIRESRKSSQKRAFARFDDDEDLNDMCSFKS